MPGFHVKIQRILLAATVWTKLALERSNSSVNPHVNITVLGPQKLLLTVGPQTGICPVPTVVMGWFGMGLETLATAKFFTAVGTTEGLWGKDPCPFCTTLQMIILCCLENTQDILRKHLILFINIRSPLWISDHSLQRPNLQCEKSPWMLFTSAHQTGIDSDWLSQSLV